MVPGANRWSGPISGARANRVSNQSGAPGLINNARANQWYWGQSILRATPRMQPNYLCDSMCYALLPEGNRSALVYIYIYIYVYIYLYIYTLEERPPFFFRNKVNVPGTPGSSATGRGKVPAASWAYLDLPGPPTPFQQTTQTDLTGELFFQ